MLFSQVAKKSPPVNPTLQQTRLCFPTVVKPEPKESSSKRKLDSTESLLPNDLRNSFGSDVKKPRNSQVVSKKEVEALIQTMKRDKGRKKLKINSRENYPSSFPSTLQTLIISGIKLKKVDKNVTILQNLTVLELCNNSLTDVDLVSSPFWRTVSVMKIIHRKSIDIRII
jgi:Leucine-rich repeat (LRR) protein